MEVAMAFRKDRIERFEDTRLSCVALREQPQMRVALPSEIPR